MKHQNMNDEVSIQYKHKSTTNWFLAVFGWKDELQPNELSSDETTTWEYALELVDVNSSPPFKQSDNEDYESDSSIQGECVLSFSNGGKYRSGHLEMGSCSNDKAWSWSINEGGVLKWEQNINNNRRKLNGRNNELVKTMLGGPFTRVTQISSDENDEQEQVIRHRQQPTQCLWRYNETSAGTEPCDASTSDTKDALNKRLVGFSVIQYQNSAAVSPKLPRFSDGTVQNQENIHSNQHSDESHLPHSMVHSASRSNSDSSHHQKVPVGVGGYFERSQLKSNPGQKSDRIRPILSPVGVGGYYESKLGTRIGQKTKSDSRINILHHSSSSSLNSHQDLPLKPRKIPVHPYIASSKDGIYIDPSTGLNFPTDIHNYLGHDRKESGRHTLTGVGLFTKTMLKIKVSFICFFFYIFYLNYLTLTFPCNLFFFLRYTPWVCTYRNEMY